MFDCTALSLFYFDGHQFNAQFVSVVGLCEIVRIVDHAVATEHVDVLANGKIGGRIVLLFLEAHPGIDSVNCFFGQFLLFQQKREGISA